MHMHINQKSILNYYLKIPYKVYIYYNNINMKV